VSENIQLSDRAYVSHVEACLRANLNKGLWQLRDLVRNCQGAYPSLVLDILNRMGSELLRSEVEAWSRRVADPSLDSFGALDGIEGNPVLSSWYFTARACRRIERLWDWSTHRIAFLGTPRVYDWFSSSNLGASRVLLDLDALVTQKLKEAHGGDLIVNYDVKDELPHNLVRQFTCVVCDPPWYLDDYHLWIRRSRELAAGGVLCITVYPALVKPAAAGERQSILREIAQDSVSLTLLSEFLEYEIPSFELAQLAEAGVTDLDWWKVADLAIAQLTKSPPAIAPTRQPKKKDGTWHEVDIGSLRIFINAAIQERRDGPLLIPAHDTGILPSPSRREPALQHVNVMTSRGHGFICGDVTKLRLILETFSEVLAANRDPNLAIGPMNIDPESLKTLLSVLRLPGGS